MRKGRSNLLGRSNLIDLTGQRYGRLTVLRVISKANRRGAVKNVTTWECICDCGKVVIVRAILLRRGDTKSCGCLFREWNQTGGRIHGETINRKTTAEYMAWSAMKSRCYNKDDRGFKNYGGRGIVVCDRWRNDYQAFLSDMGRRHSNTHSIGRINNDGNYDPINCEWQTRDKQAQNRRRRLSRNNWLDWYANGIATTIISGALGHSS